MKYLFLILFVATGLCAEEADLSKHLAGLAGNYGPALHQEATLLLESKFDPQILRQHIQENPDEPVLGHVLGALIHFQREAPHHWEKLHTDIMHARRGYITPEEEDTAKAASDSPFIAIGEAVEEPAFPSPGSIDWLTNLPHRWPEDKITEGRDGWVYLTLVGPSQVAKLPKFLPNDHLMALRLSIDTVEAQVLPELCRILFVRIVSGKNELKVIFDALNARKEGELATKLAIEHFTSIQKRVRGGLSPLMEQIASTPGENGVEVMLAYSRSEDSNVRVKSTFLMAKFLNPKYRVRLQTMAESDNDPDVREFAKFYLERGVGE